MRRAATILGRVMGATVLVLAVAAVAIWLFAPHVPVLLAEGYPASRWPASGSFATVEGEGTVPGSRRGLHHATERLDELLVGSGANAYLAAQGGSVVVEYYSPGHRLETRFNSYSLVKSLVGFLALMAVDEGRIASLDTRLDAIDPSFAGLAVADLTLREVLDMKSGVDFERGGEKTAGGDDADPKPAASVPWNPFGSLARLHAGGLAAVLGDIATSPDRRGRFEYQNINTALVGQALEHVYGEKLEDLVSQRLWLPAGATRSYWRRHPGSGRVAAYCCLYATADDWVKVGRFLLQNGRRDRPLLSPSMRGYWLGDDIDAAARRKGAYRSFTRYDILDRPGEAAQGPFLYFLGQNGQVVYLVPRFGLAAARFGERMQLLHSTLYETLR